MSYIQSAYHFKNLFRLIENLFRASTLNHGILGNIVFFACYGRAFHYLQKKNIVYDKSSACGMHFYVKVYGMAQQKCKKESVQYMVIYGFSADFWFL